MPAYSTFPLAEYHRAEMISLLCSEWEEVGHISVKHGQAKISMRGGIANFYLKSISTDQSC